MSINTLQLVTLGAVVARRRARNEAQHLELVRRRAVGVEVGALVAVGAVAP